ncbi:aminomethyl transferase family protein, partial [Burkholderia sp. SIMBA_048]
SGEQGFEVSCASADAVALWDNILDAGKPHGAVPASRMSLEIARIEAALLFYPFDMPEGDTTPWEDNLDWMVDLDKAGDYTGKAALLAA